MSYTMIRKHILCAFLLIISINKALPEPFIYTMHFSGEDEELQGRLTGLLQDHNGFIWLSSFNGLDKYDGNRFIKYKSRPGENSVLQSNRINSIWENSEGNIWCLTSDRLYLFSVQEERFIDIQKTIESRFAKEVNVWTIYPLSNGISWAVGLNGECLRFLDSNPDEHCEVFNFNTSSFLDVLDIKLDRHGYEWVLTRNGLYRYDKKEILLKQRFDFAFETDKFFWLGARKNATVAAYSYGQNDFKYVNLDGANYIYSQDMKDHSLYSATDIGVFVTDMDNFQSELISDAELRFISVDSRNRVWGISDEHIAFSISPSEESSAFDDRGTSWDTRRYSLPDDFQFDYYDIYVKEDDYGLIWLVFKETSDILHVDEASSRFIRPINSLPNGLKSQSVYEDRQGRLWFRKESSIDCIELHNYPIGHIHEASENKARSFLMDADSCIWIGDQGMVVTILNAQKEYVGNLSASGKIVRDRNCLFGAAVYCMMQDSKGNIWMGTKADGVFVAHPKQNGYELTHYDHNESDPFSLSYSSVYDIKEDSFGHIWIGSFGGGLNLFDNGRFIHSQNNLDSSKDMPKTIRCLCEVTPGILMIGSKEGLFVMDCSFEQPNHIRMYANKKHSEDITSLSDNDIMSILKRKNGEIFISTNSGGVCQIVSDTLLSDHLEFKCWNSQRLLESDITYSITEDKDENLWIVSPQMLSQMRLDSDTIVYVYDATYFPNTVSFSEAIPFRFGEELWFGERNSVINLRPGLFLHHSYCPSIAFTNLSIRNQVVTNRLRNNTLYLGSKERTLTIQFLALYFGSQRRIKYAYKLDGMDAHWNETSDNSVTYVNLPPGEHTFHVRSTDADGIWMDNEKVITLSIKPTFFESVFGKICLSVLAFILFSIIIFFFQRIFRLRHRLSVEKELTDAKIRFFTDISHELRTPLTLVEGPVSEVLSDNTLSTESRYYLELVQKNVRRMLNLVNQILDFRKIQNHKMGLVVEQLDINQQIRLIMQNFQGLAQQHDIVFWLDCPDTPITIWGDRDKIEKIFFNLLGNAFKYTQDHKRIGIRIQELDKAIRISVEDEGCGIKKEDLANLFQRFETIAKDNLFKPSSGIGLALVKQLVDLHHGTIETQSTPGVGSTFSVSLLKGKNHFKQQDNVEFYVNDMPDSPEEKTNDNMEDVTENANGTTVLLVEDNDELRDFIRRILEPTHKVIEACHGEQGLNLCKTALPDLIVTDLMMPVMDGFEMIQRIKSDDDIYQTPIIVLTAKDTMDDRIKGIELGAEDYVMKPFSAEYLRVRVNTLIEQRQKLKQRLLEMLSEGNTALAKMAIEPNMPKFTPADELFVQETMAFMENNMDNPSLTIDQFAEALHLGRSVFYNKLKTTLGLSPIDFVQQMRLKRAAQLLNSHNYNISEVAYSTGFNDPKYFSRCFKKYYGKSPSEFSKSM